MSKLLNWFLIIAVAAVFVLAIVMYACSYTVRFTETAVRTTFGKASETSVITEPGFHWKAPYPVQSVTKYDRRVRLVNTRSETQQTADDFQIVVQAYMTYRVSDPLLFFQRFSNAGDRSQDHYRMAEDNVLRARLRAQLGETSRYRMDELFTPERGTSKLSELEDGILTLLRDGSDGGLSLSEYGVEVVTVGIDRIVLPEETTQRVVDRMGANRDRLADGYESEGVAQALSITSKAQADADKIRQFALHRAALIESRGYQEAAPYMAEMAADEDLAVYLENIRLMRESMSKRFTLVLSTSNFGLGLFSPEIAQELSAGTIPAPERPGSQR
ncbi:MAG: protein HflC [Phycisphaeraceae bacterium]|nr:MAG: protein HflC [Phycisphaeraceae bacterium]